MARRKNPDDLHRDDLIRLVARNTGHTHGAIHDIMAGVVDEIADAMMRGQDVVWTGLGRFEMRHRTAHRAVNPKTGERIVIPAHAHPGCTIGTTFKERVRVLTSSPYEGEKAAD